MGAKKGNSHIREEIRQEIAKQYKDRLDSLIKENKDLKSTLDEQTITITTLQTKVKEYEDWLERMQDFCNLSEEDRKQYIDKAKTSEDIMKRCNNLMDLFGNLIGEFNSFYS